MKTETEPTSDRDLLDLAVQALTNKDRALWSYVDSELLHVFIEQEELKPSAYHAVNPDSFSRHFNQIGSQVEQAHLLATASVASFERELLNAGFEPVTDRYEFTLYGIHDDDIINASTMQFRLGDEQRFVLTARLFIGSRADSFFHTSHLHVFAEEREEVE